MAGRRSGRGVSIVERRMHVIVVVANDLRLDECVGRQLPFLASSKNCSSEKKLVANFLRRRDAWMIPVKE